MNLQLQRLRKLAGFKTQKEVADALGVPERRYASWEREEAMINLEQAYNCGYWESMNDKGRSALLGTAELMSGSPDTRIEKDRAASPGIPAQVERSA